MTETIADRELTLTRLIDAPARKAVCRLGPAGSDAAVVHAAPEDDAAYRDGCASRRCKPDRDAGPDGEEFPNRGVYLDVVENERLVLTDAFVSAWERSEKPFMTGTITLEEEGGKTRYTARALHWSVADRKAHEKMGFHEGWRKATDQLEALVAPL